MVEGSGAAVEEKSIPQAAALMELHRYEQTFRIPILDPESISIQTLGLLETQGSAYVVARAEG